MPDRRWLKTFENSGKINLEVPSSHANYGKYRNNYETNGLQRELIRIPKFDYQEAFALATLARKLSREEFPNILVVIDISLPNGHSLMRFGTDVGSALHDDCWIKEKQKTAMEFGFSSFFMELKLRQESKKKEFLDSKKYAFDGGALPIFIDSCEFPVACLTISGLKRHENHWLAVESVRDYIININDSAGRYTTDSVSEEQTVDCAICLSEVRIGMRSCVTPCNHIFHDECLSTWRNYNPQCPLCRSEIPRT